MDYLEKFQRMIEEYNAGSLNIEKFFDELIKFAQALSEEEKRGIAENLTEEELVLFDLLTKPEPKLTKQEEAEVKKVVKALLDTLKREKLVLDWRKRQQSRQAVRLSVKQILDTLPRAYSPELYELMHSSFIESLRGSPILPTNPFAVRCFDWLRGPENFKPYT